MRLLVLPLHPIFPKTLQELRKCATLSSTIPCSLSHAQTHATAHALHPIFPKCLQELRKCGYTVPYNRKTRPRPRTERIAPAPLVPYRSGENDSVSRANARNCARPIRRQPTARHARRNAAMSARIARQTALQKARQNALLRVKNTTGRCWTSTGPTRAHFRQPGAPDNPSAKKIMVAVFRFAFAP